MCFESWKAKYAGETLGKRANATLMWRKVHVLKIQNTLTSFYHTLPTNSLKTYSTTTFLSQTILKGLSKVQKTQLDGTSCSFLKFLMKGLFTLKNSQQKAYQIQGVPGRKTRVKYIVTGNRDSANVMITRRLQPRKLQ